MEIDWILIIKVIFIGLLHWTFVLVALRSLLETQKVILASKKFWAIIILFITCIGPLTYLILHQPLDQGSLVTRKNRYP